MRKRTLTACLLIGVTAALELATPASAGTSIVGGTNATETYTFMASIQTRNGDQICGASLIASQWLVTAGHCVSDPHTLDVADPAQYQFRVGSADRTRGGEVVGADRFIRHEKWDTDLNNDIALVHLTEPVVAAPVAIGATPKAGTPIRELGWGTTCVTHGCDAPVILQQLDTSIARASACNDPFFNPARQLCTDNNGGTANACRGDSGGPALINRDGRWLLVGATSHGQTDVCTEKAGIYTDVPFYRNWINQRIHS
ncbi:serine protease [Amycolatopsis carbonis]|uniref:Serine protease n=1 Tax=Amycolatopsis carbonis TaxID=715471 RepID=A0A9Y2IRT8_9PSEU|nr:serine protease [Amycolatopsis sp. 2-15]WIX83628.1 serine protease [Amycolatopsis sp. 2-15]